MSILSRVKNPLSGDPVWNVLMLMLLAGIIFLVMSCVHLVINPMHGKNEFWTNIGVCLLFAGGCYSGGALTGFLFGIPRVLSNPMSAPDEMKNNSTNILQNDNLVQISDWLTKIIVGVGLTQLTHIPHYLNHIGQKFSSSTGGEGQTAVNSAIIILVYFTIIGFFFGYLWSRLFFPKMLTYVDNMLNPHAELSAFSNTFSGPIELMKQKMKESIVDDDKVGDPQKGKWGGKTRNNNRQVTGAITPSTVDPDLFTVTLEVSSTDSKVPLTGNVIFHLHPSIEPPERGVLVDEGIARLSFLASKPFTVGIECDNKSTQLEIDLGSDINDLPPNFK